jgi:hypothetical protein
MKTGRRVFLAYPRRVRSVSHSETHTAVHPSSAFSNTRKIRPCCDPCACRPCSDVKATYHTRGRARRCLSVCSRGRTGATTRKTSGQGSVSGFGLSSCKFIAARVACQGACASTENASLPGGLARKRRAASCQITMKHPSRVERAAPLRISERRGSEHGNCPWLGLCPVETIAGH